MFSLVILGLLASAGVEANDFNRTLFLASYPDTSTLKVWLDGLVAPGGRCEGLGRVFSLGLSTEGREMWGIEISDKPGQNEPEPNLKMIGNIHGDESLGRSLLPSFADYLCENYNLHRKRPPFAGPGHHFAMASGTGRWVPSLESESDRSLLAFSLVRDSHVFIVPSANPDGFEAHQRENANMIDLNRNFPDPIRGISSNPNLDLTGQEQAETRNLARFLLATHFVSSLAFHEGALVANYPWDGQPQNRAIYNACPDDATYVFLAKLYARAHTTMWTNPTGEFPDGITNGAAWYPVFGGMQDYNYVKGGCMELTIELDDIKTPPPAALPAHFDATLGSLLLYPWTSAYSGVYGRVRIASNVQGQAGAGVVGATITVGSSPLRVPTGLEGEFFRPFAPGIYELQVAAPGFLSRMITVEVPVGGAGIVLEIEMIPEGETPEEPEGDSDGNQPPPPPPPPKHKRASRKKHASNKG